MGRNEKLEPLRIGTLEARPTGPLQYSVRVAPGGRELGEIRLCDDHRFEAATTTGNFAGVHKTLGEAMEALAPEAMDGTAPTPEAGPAPDPGPARGKPASAGRIRPVRRGLYGGPTARRSAAP